MIKHKIQKLLISIFILSLVSNLNGQIIEVTQLFNKKTTKVKEQNIGKKMSFYGSILLNETKTIDINTRFDGYITKLNANKSFMHVKKGQTLFSIYSDEVISIQKEVKISKSISKNLYTSAVDKLLALDINKTELQRIKKSKKEIKDIRVISPINAIVFKKYINEGSFVKKGKLLLQLVNMDILWFVAKVYQKDLNFIKKDMSAKIYIDGISKSIKSKVDYIYPIVDSKTKTVDVRFIIDNKDLKLYPNMFAKVVIKSSKKTVLTLPKTAVLSKGDKYYVFKPISVDEIEPVLIEAKRISSSKYEILDGLKAGEEVINNALFLLDSDAVTNNLYDDDEDTDW